MEGKVLFVSTVNPFGLGGGPQAMRAYMDAIIDIFGRTNVSIMAPSEVTIPKEYEDIDFILIPRRARLIGLYEMLYGHTGRFSKQVVRFLKNNPTLYSWCIFNIGRESGWSFKRLSKLSIKKVTIHHNQEVEYCMDNKTIYTFGGIFPYIVSHQEKNSYKYSDLNLFLTRQDKDAFEKMYGSTNAVNELIGTFDYKDATIITNVNGANKTYNLVASGSLSQFQTVHGIMDFCEHYLDISTKLIPNLKVLLTGRNPRQVVLDLQKKNSNVIDVVASPANIQNEVIKGEIFLCPTDIGGGLKLRAMDGLKNGLPILIHERSSRGYDFFFDKPYFRIYNSKESFERGLRDLLNFLHNNPSCAENINSDYYSYFGYPRGVARLKKSLSLLSN